jgi:hypothetical protein
MVISLAYNDCVRAQSSPVSEFLVRPTTVARAQQTFKAAGFSPLKRRQYGATPIVIVRNGLNGFRALKAVAVKQRDHRDRYREAAAVCPWRASPKILLDTSRSTAPFI